MSLDIENEETRRLARELAGLTGGTAACLLVHGGRVAAFRRSSVMAMVASAMRSLAMAVARRDGDGRRPGMPAVAPGPVWTSDPRG